MWLTALAIVSFYLPVVAAESDGNLQADSIPSPNTFFYDDLAQSINIISDDEAQFGSKQYHHFAHGIPWH